MKHVTDVFISDTDNFADAGYHAMKEVAGEGEVEDVCLMKTLKPAVNIKYTETNKVFIVKSVEDIEMEDDTTKTMKYPVPFYANNNDELQTILKLYIEQGLQNIHVTTVSEIQWAII